MLAARHAIIVAIFVQRVAAAPWNALVRQTTHNVVAIDSRSVKLQSYHPEPIFETYGVEGIDHPLTKRGISGTPQDAAKAFLEEKLRIAPDSLASRSAHNSDIASHEYFRQRINGIPVVNAVANVAIERIIV